MRRTISISFAIAVSALVAIALATRQNGAPQLPTIAVEIHQGDPKVIALNYIDALKGVMLGEDGNARPDIGSAEAKHQLDVAERLAGQLLEMHNNGETELQVDAETVAMLIGWRRPMVLELVRLNSELDADPLHPAHFNMNIVGHKLVLHVAPACGECAEFLQSIGIKLAREWVDQAQEAQTLSVSSRFLDAKMAPQVKKRAEATRQRTLLFLSPEFSSQLEQGSIELSVLMLHTIEDQLHFDLFERLVCAEAQLLAGGGAGTSDKVEPIEMVAASEPMAASAVA